MKTEHIKRSREEILQKHSSIHSDFSNEVHSFSIGIFSQRKSHSCLFIPVPKYLRYLPKNRLTKPKVTTIRILIILLGKETLIS